MSLRKLRVYRHVDLTSVHVPSNQEPYAMTPAVIEVLSLNHAKWILNNIPNLWLPAEKPGNSGVGTEKVRYSSLREPGILQNSRAYMCTNKLHAKSDTYSRDGELHGKI